MKNKQKQRPKQIFMSRTKCDCMAQKHQLINNCLNCGKVVCAQQGQGNCLYCGKLVTRPDSNYIDDSEGLFPSLSKQDKIKVSVERSKAIQHKNKLVERDKSEFQNQNIFDEQLDYYEISQNKWLDDNDRNKAIERILEKQKFIEEEQFKTKIRYDPMTGQFVREEFSFNEDEFKKQGQKFLEEQQKKQKKQKQEKAKRNWDQRIIRSQKMRDLCQTLLLKKEVDNSVQLQKQFKKKTCKNLVEIVIEDEIQNK